MTPQLVRIRIYPVKSLDPIEVEEAAIRGGAGVAHDREFRLVDEDGDVVNGKRYGEALLRIRSRFDLAFAELELSDERGSVTARLGLHRSAAEKWISERIGRAVRFEQDSAAGFPDDEEASGPTVISRATLLEIAAWFGLEEEEVRRRFRANLEVDGVPAFWEDRFAGPEGEARPFAVGDVSLAGVNPCQRCTVPSRDSRTGEMRDSAFSKSFATKREETLPSWAERTRFDHFYRLALNTAVPPSENGKVLQVGDEVRW